MAEGFHISGTWVTIAALLINAGLAFIPAKMAHKKGYSFAGQWCISFFVSFLIGIIFAAALPKKTEAAENELESSATKRMFSRSYLGFVMIGILLIFTLVLGSFTPHFLDLRYLMAIIMKLVPYGLIVIAVALTTRAKGPDLSLGAVMTLSGVIAATVFTASGSVAASIAAALLSAVLAGAANGVLTVYLRLPSVLASSVTLLVLSALSWVITQGQPMIVRQFNELTQTGLPGAAILLLFALIVAFLFIYFTRLGKPMNTRTTRSVSWLISSAHRLRASQGYMNFHAWVWPCRKAAASTRSTYCLYSAQCYPADCWITDRRLCFTLSARHSCT